MRRICWHMDRLTCAYHLLRAPEGGLNLALKHGKCLIEVVAVRRRPAIRRYVHVDQTKAAPRVFSREKNGVRVSSQPNVRKLLLGVGLHKDKIPSKVVGWDG